MRRSPLLVAAVVATSGLAAPSGLHAGPATALHATRLDGAEVAIPGRPGRTLLILGFQHADQDALEAWRRGLGLADADARWLEIAVIPVKSPMIQPMIRNGMRNHFKTDAQRAHFAPMFADAAPVAARFDLSGLAPGVVVLDGDGRVLAHADGPYDRAKAEGLLAALNAAP
jgi:hypothetical protein